MEGGGGGGDLCGQQQHSQRRVQHVLTASGRHWLLSRLIVQLLQQIPRSSARRGWQRRELREQPAAQRAAGASIPHGALRSLLLVRQQQCRQEGQRTAAVLALRGRPACRSAKTACQPQKALHTLRKPYPHSSGRYPIGLRPSSSAYKKPALVMGPCARFQSMNPMTP